MSRNFFRRIFGSKSAASQKQESSPLAFRERVEDFWRWFSRRELQLYEGIQDQSFDPSETHDALNRLHEDISWEYGPAEEEGRESFSLSGAGRTTIRLLVNYAIRQAPTLDHWNFHTSKQASESALKVRVGDEELDFAEFSFELDFDPDAEHLKVSVSHPSFARIPKDVRQQLMMIALDNALGENFVEAWIGPLMETPERTPEQKFSWNNLRGQARAAISVHDLDPDLDPIDRWYAYSCHEPGDGDVHARADIIAGTTCHLELVQTFYDPDRLDQLADCGAVFAYLMMPIGKFGEGMESEERGQIETSLGRCLQANASGIIIGGASGRQYAYIDMILFDEGRALTGLKSELAEIAQVEAATLRFFPLARSAERVILK